MKLRRFLYVLLTVIFGILLVLTVAYARSSYELSRQMAPDDNISNYFAKGIITVLTVPHLILELEIYHVILYFISGKQKRSAYKTKFNIAELLILFGSIGLMYLYGAASHSDDGVSIMLSLFCAYMVVKIIHLVVWLRDKNFS